MIDVLTRRLNVIEDREQINEVIYKYCRAMDRGDPALLREVFWSDGGFGPGKPTATAAVFVEPLVAALVAKYEATHHAVHNILIDLDGDRADVESYSVVYHRSFPTRESNEAVFGGGWLGPDGIDPKVRNDFVAGVRYLDRFEKREGIWRILIRSLVFDWTEVRRSNDRGFGALNDETILGCRGQADYLYSRVR